MSKRRFAANCDKNEPEMVEALRRLGIIVEQGHDDCLLACQGLMFWLELKSENAVSKTTGKILESHIEPSQKKIRSIWNDTYIIAATLEQIIEGMNKVFKRCGLRTVRIK